MKTLYEALATVGNGPFVAKQLNESGITDWPDCTRVNLSDWVNDLTERVSPGTAHNYTSVLKAVLNRYKESGIVPCADISAALKCKKVGCQKIYLNENELNDFENVLVSSNRERFVKLCFLVSAKTGMRVSDALKVTPDNIKDGMLTYVSQKTKIEASIPVSDKVAGWITRLNELPERVSIQNYELILRRLCERAGIDSRVKVFKAGKERTGKKWQFVTSHTARVTFASILAEKEAPTRTIMRLMGHTNEIMTMGYIAYKGIKLTDSALNFLKQ